MLLLACSLFAFGALVDGWPVGEELEDCYHKFPNLRKRLEWEEYMLQCMGHRQFQELSGRAKSVIDERQFFTDNQLAYLHSFDGGLDQASFDEPALRMEYRSLSSAERAAFHRAIRKLNSEQVDGASKYKLFGLLHNIDLSPSAHIGPAVLLWHREFLRRFEVALRRIDPAVGLPYWDPTMEISHDEPSASVLWSAKLMGSFKGVDSTSDFTNPNFEPNTTPLNFTRNLGEQSSMKLTEAFFREMMKYKSLSEFGACKNSKFENALRLTRQWIGGDMKHVKTAGKDPLFYMLLAYVDMKFDQWLESNPNVTYPHDHDCCNIFHYANREMFPFRPLKNEHGLSKAYTALYYRYKKPPTCNQILPSCKSPFLFCDIYSNQCVARLQAGSVCSVEDWDANPCYISECKKGKCQLTKRSAMFADQPEVQEPVFRLDGPFKIFHNLL